MRADCVGALQGLLQAAHPGARGAGRGCRPAGDRVLPRAPAEPGHAGLVGGTHRQAR